MLAYLLDTNAISEPLRPKPNKQLLQQLAANEGRLAIAAIVWHELVYGYERLPKSRRRDVIEHYLFDVIQPTIPILPYTERAAQWHARERARLAQQGRQPSFADGQIAAVAAAEGLALVTANVTDFQGFQDLAVENWLL